MRNWKRFLLVEALQHRGHGVDEWERIRGRWEFEAEMHQVQVNVKVN